MLLCWFAIQTMLRSGIKASNEERNQEHLIDVLELLRDSYVWIPCNATGDESIKEKELAKEFRKKNGTRMPAEIILIGGASILVNYGFREMTYDMDAIIKSSGAMKEAINILQIRTVSAEYLVAMKLMAGRQ